MERILFATDLDGTLLNDNGSLAPEFAARLNKLMAEGCLFTIASARAPASARPVLDSAGLRLTAPAVCLNGSLLWDMERDLPVHGFSVSPEITAQVLEAFRPTDVELKFFGLDMAKGTLTTFYRDDVPVTEHILKFLAYMRRSATARLPLQPASAYDGSQVVGFSSYDRRERLDDLYEKLRVIEGLKTVYYTDNYREGYMFLECGAEAAGKGAGAKAAQAAVHADRLYVFGDNLNDMDMYRRADRSFAPANGEEAMRTIASEVIPCNNDGGVVTTIEKYFRA